MSTHDSHVARARKIDWQKLIDMLLQILPLILPLFLDPDPAPADHQKPRSLADRAAKIDWQKLLELIMQLLPLILPLFLDDDEAAELMARLGSGPHATEAEQ